MRLLPVVSPRLAQLAQERPAAYMRLLVAAVELRLRTGGMVWLCGSGLRDLDPADWDLRVTVAHREVEGRVSFWAHQAAERTQQLRAMHDMTFDVRIYPAEGFYPGDAVRLDEVPVVLAEPPVASGSPQDAQRAIEENKDKPEFHVLIGNLMMLRGDKKTAQQAFTRALNIDPRCAPAWLNLSSLAFEQREYKQAALFCSRAIEIDPAYAKAYCNLANAVTRLGAPREALKFYDRAIRLEPDVVAYHHNKGTCLTGMGLRHAAAISLRRAFELDPGDSNVLNSTGNLYVAQENFYAGAAYYTLGIRMNQRHAPLYTNLANALFSIGMERQARVNYERGLVLDPKNAGVRYNLSLCYLRDGEYRLGWKTYESRFGFEELQTKPRGFRQPQWNGENFAGKRLLIHAEQGKGDTFQFCRYLPLVAARGGKVVFEVQHGLQRLMAAVDGVGEIRTRGMELGEFDMHCPLLSLPALFRTDLRTIPSAIPYIRPWDWEVEAMRTRFRGEEDALRIGISWAGNPRYKADKVRSFSLWEFRTLADVEGVEWYSLQKGPAARQIEKYGAVIPVIDASDDARDFAESAALMATLDLVITSDTSIAHLAGAMGLPVWVLLAHLPDWRWMRDSEDYPWYPTMRLFRQPSPGDWQGVFGRVRMALERVRQLHTVEC